MRGGVSVHRVRGVDGDLQRGGERQSCASILLPPSRWQYAAVNSQLEAPRVLAVARLDFARAGQGGHAGRAACAARAARRRRCARRSPRHSSVLGPPLLRSLSCSPRRAQPRPRRALSGVRGRPESRGEALRPSAGARSLVCSAPSPLGVFEGLKTELPLWRAALRVSRELAGYCESGAESSPPSALKGVGAPLLCAAF